MNNLEQWKRAALLKDRTRRVIRDRARSKESIRAIAKDFDVPLIFVRHLREWQLFEEDSAHSVPPLSEKR